MKFIILFSLTDICLKFGIINRKVILIRLSRKMAFQILKKFTFLPTIRENAYFHSPLPH